MRKKMNFIKKATSILLLMFILAIGVFAETLVGFLNLPSYGIIGGKNVRLTVRARGRETISYGVTSRVGGVLFQETAVPGAGLENRPISLEYRPNQPDGQRLIVTIGNTAITADIYDWQIIPTARFANTEYTACMTLLGRPRTRAEIQIHNNRNETSIMWTEFHPDLINTLVGISLFFIDAILIDGNRNPLRQVTNNLSGTIPGYNDIAFNERLSALSAFYIRRLLINQRGNWDSYIYTDYGTEIRYHIHNGKLVFTGVPSYLFVSFDHNAETSTVNQILNDLIQQEINHVRNINPIIFNTAEQTAQWAAFFRMLKEQYPQAWQRFISQISGVTPLLQIETPRYWIRE
jgi:hypothetical protein